MRLPENMNGNAHSAYEFGGFVLDNRQKLLTRNGEIVRIAPKTFEILAFLAERPNEVISKEEIMNAVWHDSYVEDANLTVHISALRKIFAASKNGSAENRPVNIETFPKKGYRFVAYVNESPRNENVNIIVDALGDVSVGHIPNDPPTGDRPRTFRRPLVVSVGILMLSVAGYFLISGFRGSNRAEQSMVPVAGMEKTAAYALSPNGEYVAHAPNIDGQAALYMTHLASNSRVQLIPPGPSAYLAMEFSSDGSWLYFLRFETNTTVLYKIPILGAPPIRLLDGVGFHFSFSASGDQVCFRRVTETGETEMVIARPDGSNARTFATRSKVEPYSDFSFGLSPDGTKLASIVGGNVVIVDVATGVENVIATLAPSGLGDGLRWLRDGSGLIASTSEKDGLPSQLWHVAHPSGSVTRITNDLNAYGKVDVAADGNTVISARYEDISRLWVSAFPFDSFTPVTTTYNHRFNWVRWGTGGSVVFGSNASSNRDVWMMDRDGSNERQITKDAGNNIMPIVSPDGRYVIFASNRGGEGDFDLWRVNIDGNDAIRLTNGPSANQPAISPDSRLVYYTSGKVDGPPEERSVWRVSVDGGDEKQIIAGPAYGADFSPDGTMIACWTKPDKDSPWKIGVYSADGGSSIKLFDAQRGQPVKWTADGAGIAYAQNQKGVSNIWIQPIDGSAPRQITGFTSDRILQFDWSVNNEIIASRTERRSDIVMIRNFR